MFISFKFYIDEVKEIKIKYIIVSIIGFRLINKGDLLIYRILEQLGNLKDLFIYFLFSVLF